ncbi:unnamed protein product [Closterium sp. NIES-54]
MDMWGPARVSGQSRERYFLLVVDDYTRYTTLRERFGQDLPVLRLHSDRGGEFSSTLLRDFCRGEGILQSFTLPDSPQQNGIAEHHIGLVMEVARTSMIDVAAPHFLWPFAVRYAAHQLNLWPRVSLTETSPTLRWAGEVGDASVFWVWGSRAFVCDTSADKLSPCAIPTSCLTICCCVCSHAELLEFVAACCLDYAIALVAESASPSPPSVGGECALCTDVLEDRQEDFESLAAAVPRFTSMLLAPEGDPDAPDILTPLSYAEAITGPHSSQWQAAMDVEMASWKSTGTYVDEVPPAGANIVDGMWIFRVKRLPGSLPAFKARYVAQGFSQRKGVDYFHTISPILKMTTLWVLLHVAARRDYKLRSLDFSTAFSQGNLYEEIWLRRPPGFTGLFPAGSQWSLHRPFYGLRQAPHEWHDTLRTTLAVLGFASATAGPSLFLRTDTSLPPFYVLIYVDDLVFATAHTETLTLVKSELQKRHTCTDLGELHSYLGLHITRDRARRTITLTQSHMVHHVLQRFFFYTSGMGLVLGGRSPVVLTAHAYASWVDDSATLRSSQGYTFSLGSDSVFWRSTRSSLVLSSSCEAEIYAMAMAAQELRCLTYLLTDLGEQPCSPPVLYVDNKAMIALCQEH